MDEVVVVIDDLHEHAREFGGALETLSIDTEATKAGIDQLAARVAGLAETAGVAVADSRAASPRSREPPDVAGGSWSRVVAAARARAAARGIDLNQISLDPLLTKEDIERIERRFGGSFRLKSRLDRYDAACVVLAATVGAVIDIFLVKIPRTSQLLAARGAAMHGGSPVTEWLHAQSDHHQNALSAWFKVPYDHVDLTATGEIIAGSGGKTHRYHTLGHDPLLGLLFGIVDIFYGSTTGIDRLGHLKYIPATGMPNHDPLAIIVRHAGHLASDAFTKMGLPPPGWNASGALQLGSIGADQATAGELARGMYIAGYDSRHFLTQALSVAATDLTLGACWHIRHRLDDDWRERVEHEAILANAENMRHHPRFEAMALGAHLITCAANAGKIALYGGSPLAFNYAGWMRFIHASFAYARRWLISPTDLMNRQAAANAQALLDGWPEIDFSLADAPRLDGHGPG